MKLNWKKILKYIPSEKQEEVKKQIELDHLDAVTSSYPIIIDEDGRLRFKANKVVRWISNNLRDHPTLNLNSLAIAYDAKLFSLKDYKEYYRQLGYSLSGFAEVFNGY